MTAETASHATVGSLLHEAFEFDLAGADLKSARAELRKFATARAKRHQDTLDDATPSEPTIYSWFAAAPPGRALKLHSRFLPFFDEFAMYRGISRESVRKIAAITNAPRWLEQHPLDFVSALRGGPPISSLDDLRKLRARWCGVHRIARYHWRRKKVWVEPLIIEPQGIRRMGVRWLSQTGEQDNDPFREFHGEFVLGGNEAWLVASTDDVPSKPCSLRFVLLKIEGPAIQSGILSRFATTFDRPIGSLIALQPSSQGAESKLANDVRQAMGADRAASERVRASGFLGEVAANDPDLPELWRRCVVNHIAESEVVALPLVPCDNARIIALRAEHPETYYPSAQTRDADP